MTLAGLTWEVCLAYLDDFLNCSNIFDQHLVQLKVVLDRLVEVDLKFKPSKCSLFHKRVTFLGSTISGEGIEPDP